MGRHGRVERSLQLPRAGQREQAQVVEAPDAGVHHVAPLRRRALEATHNDLGQGQPLAFVAGNGVRQHHRKLLDDNASEAGVGEVEVAGAVVAAKDRPDFG